MERSAHELRLRRFHQAYCSTLDNKTAVIKLHETIIRCVRLASAVRGGVKGTLLENRALRILNLLTGRIKDSRLCEHADTATCDRLLIIYHAASIHLHNGRYQETINLINPLLRK
jgi:propanediol dehydratase large subunit